MYKLNAGLSDFFYNRLPRIYRSLDVQYDYPLKKYISAIVDGGFTTSLKEVINLRALLDPEKCPSKYLPYLCKNLGVEYFPYIAEEFQRKFLANFMEINMRRGTKSCIEYIVRELSGYDVDIDVVGNNLNVQMVAYDDDAALLTKQSVITTYITSYVPVGLILNVLTAYNYIDSDNFITNSTDGDTLLQVTTSLIEDPQVQCSETEDYSLTDISARCDTTGPQKYDDDSTISITGVDISEWFYSNNFNLDIVTTDGVSTPIFY